MRFRSFKEMDEESKRLDERHKELNRMMLDMAETIEEHDPAEAKKIRRSVTRGNILWRATDVVFWTITLGVWGGWAWYVSSLVW